MKVQRFWPSSGGWQLDVRRHHTPARLDRSLKPVLLIPGYCMNTTPLGFHPEGMSMIELLAERGFEVWTANLRGQGDSRSVGGPRNVGFRELVLGDLASAIREVRERTAAAQDRVDVVGCSLGGTYVFAYLAHHVTDHGIGSFVGIGAPLRWEKPHALMKIAFQSPALASRLHVSGTRAFAKAFLPLLAERFPAALSMYMNTSIVDLSRADELVKTVEDPIPKLNGEIARWLRSGDLEVAGVNVTRGLERVDRPFLAIVANRDGIVPPESARTAADVVRRSDVLEVGDDETWFAHADLFISRYSQERVFEPLARWLRDRTDD